ncbi:MAG: hypothetical protein QOJ02_1729 [Acidobacteriota bacterium]|nr:hypothetical protein [Acidobacteriota bacterium]
MLRERQARGGLLLLQASRALAKGESFRRPWLCRALAP